MGLSFQDGTKSYSMKNSEHRSKKEAGGFLGGFFVAIAVVGLYLALQLWILPSAGVPT